MMFFNKDHAKKKTGLAVAAVVLCCAPFTAREEGLRTKAYLDIARVPTICYGETENVQLGDELTAEECTTKLYAKLGAYSVAVDLAVTPPMKTEFHAALTSWTYNVGLAAMRRSTLIKKANVGDFVGACNELPKWRFAAGQPILLARRERERQLCLKGI